ncbi:MAG: 5'-methylthioadenosine/S-adenosylhomocysteine nucleosidase [Oscillospiraceae bacterium]|nr:5'-methylthioadenosine/S-adenosylhomocysteine nucleosidase [Oscillospiraceae bacterium]
MIGILCAGDREVAPFIPIINNCVISKKAMLTFYSGEIEGVSVVTLFSGVCRTNAAIATQILIDTYHCDAIINAGTAGGMAKNVKLFDTVVSTESAYWDIHEDMLTTFHPWMPTVYFPADKDLLAAAKSVAAQNRFQGNVHFGKMLTGESFIEDKCREALNEKFSPLSVDMETAAVAHVCYVNKIPTIAVRTITDTADHIGADAVADFENHCDKASRIAADFVIAMLKEMSNQHGLLIGRKP